MNENEPKKLDPNELNGGVLAYYGDAVIELLARERVLHSGSNAPGKLNVLASKYVRATEQSRALEHIFPVMTEREHDIFRRGRNASHLSVPKSASVGEYRRATGMEALFGFIWLSGEYERARRLFDLAFPEEDAEN